MREKVFSYHSFNLLSFRLVRRQFQIIPESREQIIIVSCLLKVLQPMVNRCEAQQSALRRISSLLVHVFLPFLELLGPIALIPGFTIVQTVKQFGILLGNKMPHVIGGIFAIELSWSGS